jgi:hypothetical protein
MEEIKMIKALKSRRLFGVSLFTVLSVALVLALMGGSALAAVLITKSVPATVMVKAGYGLGVYSDSGCTVPLAQANFGEVKMSGGVKTLTMYVRNESDVQLYIRGTTNLAPAQGSINWNGLNGSDKFGPGSSATAEMTLTTLANPEGTMAFTLTFNGQDTQ